MLLHEQAWWPDFVAALNDRALVSVAPIYGLDPAQAVAALVAADDRGAAQDQAWWPEALRIVDQFSIRQAARTFETSPRRIRRALARTARRVGGRDLDGGVPALAPHRDRLGQVPDHVLAEEAGVPVEAVQGERRRLDIAPFQPGGRDEDLPPSADEVPPEADEAGADAADGSGSDAGDDTARVRDAGGVRVVRRPARAGSRRRVQTFRRPEVERAEPQEPRPKVRPSGVASLDALPRPPASEPEPSPEPTERRRLRSGRSVVIRKDVIERGPERETPPPRRRVIRRHKGKGPHGEVRELQVEDVDLSDVIADAADAAPAPVVPETAPVEAPAVEEAVAHQAVAEEPAAEEAGAEAAPAEEPTVEAPTVEEPTADSPEERLADELLADALPSPSTSPSPADAPATQRYGWVIEVDGEPSSPLFLAVDALEAAERASRWAHDRLPVGASLRRLGPQLLPGGR